MTRPAFCGRAALLIMLAACESENAGPDPDPLLQLAETCSADGVLHGGTIASEQWLARDNPHAVVDTLDLTGILTVEAGVEVCIEPDMPIVIGDNGAIAESEGLRGADVVVSNCVVHGGAANGIVVPATSSDVVIHECAIESNQLAGVQNLGSHDVDARFNWWGDPAGPLGPNGDGVEGNVDYSEYRMTPP